MKYIFSILLVIGLQLLKAQDRFEARQIIDPALYPFFHGVASGDPLSDRVILWTRISPQQQNDEIIEVKWRICLDSSMTQVVNQGTFLTGKERDYTVKVDAGNLQANTFYYYDFQALGRYSIRGRTKTISNEQSIEELRMAVLSCSNYEYGYFNAYRHVAQRNDIDMVLHLGDYIYEYEIDGYSAGIEDRKHEPENEIITLQDYRIRHSHYKLDKDLQAIHQQYPFICVWDDHESANNSWKNGAENHTEGAEGTWADRFAYSKQSYLEWMPIRETENGGIYRQFIAGNLVNLLMLDTRIEGRDEQAQTGDIQSMDDPNRRLLGDEQFNWLSQKTQASNATWTILGQQIMMAPLRAGSVPINSDQWDGYSFERKRVYDLFRNNNNTSLIVLTGDIHSSWANDLPYDEVYEPITGTGSVGVEFICTSVTSPGIDIPLGNDVIKGGNPHVQYLDLQKKGYLILHLTPTYAQGDWFYTGVNTPTETEEFGAAYKVVKGSKHLVEEGQASASNRNFPPLAPANPIGYVSGLNEDAQLSLFGIYPNPFKEELFLQYFSHQTGTYTLKVYSQSGQIIYSVNMEHQNKGVQYFKISASSWPQGQYTIVMEKDRKIVATNCVLK